MDGFLVVPSTPSEANLQRAGERCIYHNSEDVSVQMSGICSV